VDLACKLVLILALIAAIEVVHLGLVVIRIEVTPTGQAAWAAWRNMPEPSGETP